MNFATPALIGRARDGVIASVADVSKVERFARLGGRRALAVLATAGLLAAVAVPAATALNTSSATVLTLTNNHRAAHDTRKLTEYPAMTDVAQAWAERLAAAGELSHNPNYSKQIPSGWKLAGENVAYNCGFSDGATKLFSQWKASAAHNANMLNSTFTHIGVGVAKDSDGCFWGVQVFAAYPSGSVSDEDLGIDVDPFEVAPAPIIAGTPKAGVELKAVVDSWSPSATMSYRWFRNGVAISGAAYSRYTVTTADRGARLTVKVTGKASGLATTSKSSASVYVPKLFGGTSPAITGTARAGKTLSVSSTNWSPTPTSLTYQWYRNGIAIAGATGKYYKVTSTDRGKKLTVKVKATRSGFTTTTRTSAHKTVAW